MRFSALSLLALTSSAAAFSGQFSTWYEGGGEGPGILHIYVTDYSTGSTYEGRDYDGNFSGQGKEIRCEIKYMQSMVGEMANGKIASLKPAMVTIAGTLLSG